MSQDLCTNPSPVVIPPPVSLEEACRDVLRKRQLVKPPRKHGILLSCIWTANVILALMLAFLVGFCMGERQVPVGASSPSLHGAPPEAQPLPSSMPISRRHSWPG